MSARVSTFADFFDGECGLVRRAEVSMEGGLLRIGVPDRPALLWRLESIRSLPDQAAAGVLAVTSADHPLTRLYLGDERMRKALAAHAPNLRHRPPVRGRGRILGWAAAAVASVALIIFVLVPVMADQLAEYLPPEGEKALGDATLEQIRNALDETGLSGLPVCDAPQGRAALAAMTDRITSGVDLPYPLTVTVLDHEMVNAFALPGGHIVFFRGLIDEAEDPDEVAAVFAHELGHVVARDPARIALRTAGSIGVLGLLLGDFAGGAVVLFLAERLIRADYTQEAEAAADTFAHRRLAEADLPNAALARFFERLRAKYGDAEGIVAHLISHPSLGDRIARAGAAGAGQGPTRPSLDAARWQALRAICD